MDPLASTYFFCLFLLWWRHLLRTHTSWSFLGLANGSGDCLARPARHGSLATCWAKLGTAWAMPLGLVVRGPCLARAGTAWHHLKWGFNAKKLQTECPTIKMAVWGVFYEKTSPLIYKYSLFIQIYFSS